MKKTGRNSGLAKIDTSITGNAAGEIGEEGSPVSIAKSPKIHELLGIKSNETLQGAQLNPGNVSSINLVLPGAANNKKVTVRKLSSKHLIEVGVQQADEDDIARM